MKIAIIYTGHQLDYLYGLLSGLKNIPELEIVVIDSDRNIPINGENIQVLKFLSKEKKSNIGKIYRWIKYYFRLFIYIAFTDITIFHIEWINSKFDRFERRVLVFWLKLWNKHIIYKVHDLDTNLLLSDNFTISDRKYFNYDAKLFMFKYVDHFITHNLFVKDELCNSFNVSDEKVSIIPHGINNYVKETPISFDYARKEFDISEEKKVILFFGNISPYKGLDKLLVELNKSDENGGRILIIAGRFRKGNKEYKNLILDLVKKATYRVITYFKFIPDKKIELFFKAADVLILPYIFIYQSGVVFLSYRFGLPIIAKNVGGVPEDITEELTGFVYENDEDLNLVLNVFFNSALYRDKSTGRNKLVEFTKEKYSWEKIGNSTNQIYKSLLK